MYVCICMYVYVCMYTYMHIHIHTYAYILELGILELILTEMLLIINTRTNTITKIVLNNEY